MWRPRGVGGDAVVLIAASRLVSVTGTWAAQIALASTVFAQTHSAVWVSASILASAGLGGLVAPIGGHLGDMTDRKRLLVGSELCGAAVFTAMCTVSQPAVLIALALLATIAHAPFDPAAQASVPNLVRESELARANGTIAGGLNAALVIGPLVGGVLVAAAGATPVFAANAATFLASALLLTRIRAPLSGRVSRSARGALAGVRIIGASRLLLALTAISVLVFGAFGVAVVADLPLAVHFGAGSLGYGLITAVWGGGSVVGAVAARRAVVAATEVPSLVLGSIAMSISLGVIALLPAFWMIVAVGSIGGIGQSMNLVPWQGLLQRMSPDEVRSRVFAATGSVGQLGFAAAMIAAGGLVGWLGPTRTYLVPAGLLLAATFLAVHAGRVIAASSSGGRS